MVRLPVYQPPVFLSARIRTMRHATTSLVRRTRCTRRMHDCRTPTCSSQTHIQVAAMSKTTVPATADVPAKIVKGRVVGMAVAMLSVAIDMLGVSIILPIIPFLAIKFGASSFELGIVFSCYALTQMISVPISGTLSDRYGRKPLLLCSLVGSCIGFLFQGLADSLLLFMLARAAAGLFGGSVPIAQAFIADVTTKAERPKFLAILGSVVMVSFMVGPGIGAGLAEFSIQTPMLVASFVSGVAFIIAMFLFREPVDNPKYEPPPTAAAALPTDPRAGAKPDSLPQSSSAQDLNQAQDLKEAKAHILIRMVFLAAFFNMFSMTAFLSMLGLYMAQKFQYGSLEFGFIAMGCSVFVIVGQLFLFNNLHPRIGKHATGIIGALVFGLGLFIIPMPSVDSLGRTAAVWVTLIGLLVHSIGYSCVTPAIPSLLSRYAAPGAQGKTLGTSQSLQALARVIGPLMLGLLYESNPDAPFYLCGSTACMTAATFYAVLLLNRRYSVYTSDKTEEVSRQRSRSVSTRMAAMDEPSIEEKADDLQHIKLDRMGSVIGIRQRLSLPDEVWTRHCSETGTYALRLLDHGQFFITNDDETALDPERIRKHLTHAVYLALSERTSVLSDESEFLDVLSANEFADFNV